MTKPRQCALLLKTIAARTSLTATERSNATLSYKATHYHNCRWCNSAYKSKKRQENAGFCTDAHKMAHHRAYKSYVTQTTRPGTGSQAQRVTHKKRK